MCPGSGTLSSTGTPHARCSEMNNVGGFRDGRRGWIIAYATFFSVLAKYALLFEKREVTPHEEKKKAKPVREESANKSH